MGCLVLASLFWLSSDESRLGGYYFPQFHPLSWEVALGLHLEPSTLMDPRLVSPIPPSYFGLLGFMQK